MGSLSRLAKIICLPYRQAKGREWSSGPTSSPYPRTNKQTTSVSRQPRKAGPGFETDSGVLNPNNIVLPPWKVVLVVPCHRHAELR